MSGLHTLPERWGPKHASTCLHTHIHTRLGFTLTCICVCTRAHALLPRAGTCMHICTHSRAPSHVHVLTALADTCVHTARVHTFPCEGTHTHMHARRELQYLSGLRELLHMPATRCRASCAGFLGNSCFSFLPFLESVLGLLLNLPFTVPSPLYCPLQASPPHFGCCF